jgi:CO/xanthine dehydrogenase Mo-binding subunit
MWSGGMEPRACVAQWDGDHLTLCGRRRRPVSACTAPSPRCSTCPIANVRVISSYVGGGFGTKSAPHTDEALAAMLARKARLPVKLQYTREEEILDSNTRFETRIYMRVGVKKDMTLHALDVKAYINQGAYHTRLGGLGNQSTHMYKSPHVRTVQYRVHTNIPNTGPTRGVGDPQETFAIESVMDEMAIEMGWDPMEFRLKNIKRNGDPIARGASGTEDGRLVTQVLDQCIAEGASRIEWNRRNAVAGSPSGPKAARDWHRVHRTRAAAPALAGRRSRSTWMARPCLLRVDRHRPGQPHDALDDSRARVLGIPLSMFRTTAATRRSHRMTAAAREPDAAGHTAAPSKRPRRGCLQQILAAAGPMLNNAAPADLEIRDSIVRVKADPTRQVKLAEVMQRRGRTVTGDGATAALQTGIGRRAHVAARTSSRSKSTRRPARFTSSSTSPRTTWVVPSTSPSSRTRSRGEPSRDSR